MSRSITILFLTTLAGCAVAPPTSSGGGVDYGLDGKADGANWCSEAEIGFISCVADNCEDADDDEACAETHCGDVSVEVGFECLSCVEEMYGDLELAARQCQGRRTSAGPCAEDADLIECVVESCEGTSGDALLDCLDTNCGDHAEDVSEACGECILVRGQASTEGMLSCAADAPPAECTPDDLEPVAACVAENCGGLEGEAYEECMGMTCGAEFLSTPPICLQCMGDRLDAGESFEDAAAACGPGDAPATDEPRVCSYAEMEEILTCGETSCGEATGEELNECLDTACGDAFENAELSESCATCFIYNMEGGGDLAATRAACVSSPETDA